MITSPWLGLLVAGALVTASTTALAQSKKECADAYVAGQRARNEGKLREAHDQLAVCANPACPAALRGDCASWLGQVDKARPAITVRVTDAKAAAVPGARVSLDGAAVDGGSSQMVDPGDHLVRVEAEGMKPAEQRVTIAAGTHRDIVVSLEQVPAAPEPAASPSYAAPIALGVVGLASLGAFAALGAVGNGKKSDLDASGCKAHGCAPDDVSSIKTLYVSADVALGVGLASLVVSGILLIARPSADKATATALVPTVAIGPHGGAAALTMHF